MSASAESKDSRESRIERMLQEGLDFYGVDDISQAIQAWQAVLELDPRNQQALDYLQNADRRKRPRPAKGKGMASAVGAVLQEARLLMQQGDLSPALDLLRSASGPGFSTVELEATLDLVRSQLHRVHRERIGDLERVPVLCADAGDLTRFNLPSDAGFLLSMIDGVTASGDLISLSGMDAFDVLRTLDALLEAGIVEMNS
jgi:hypothetical protein